MGDLSIDLAQTEAPDAALEMEEVRDFLFDGENVIDVDALEAFVSAKRD